MKKKNFYSCCEAVANSHPPFEEVLQCVEQIAKGITSVGYKEGQTIFYQGHIPYGLFIIKKGKVHLTNHKTEVAGDDSLPAILGWAHLLKETPYCSSCVAKTDVHAIFLPKEPLLVAFRKRGIAIP